MRKMLITVVVLVVFGMLVGFTRQSAAEPKPVDVIVTLTEYKVILSRTNLPAGVPIRFFFVDSGASVHEAVLEEAEADDEPLEFEGEETEAEDINPGEARSIIWTIDKPGDYKLACHKPGHYEGGMFADFKVWPGGMLVSDAIQNAGWIGGGLALLALISGGLLFYQYRRMKTAETV